MRENTAPAVLITVPLSHYCEKARWGLDRLELPYREEPHAPLLHRLATRRNDGGTVPVLVHGSSRFIDSTDILRLKARGAHSIACEMSSWRWTDSWVTGVAF